jgi:hypothetical protein
MKIYYVLWVDLITRIRATPAGSGSWRFKSMLLMSMAMALNLALIIALLQNNILHVIFYDFKIDILPGQFLDGILNFCLMFLVPIVLINYFFIFHNDKYAVLCNRYSNYNGRLFIAYFYGSLGTFLVYAFFFA